MVTALLTTLMLLSPPPTAEPAQERSTPKEQFESLLEEYKAAYDAYNAKRFAPTAPEDDIDHTIRTYLAWPAFEFVPRFLKLAEDHPKDPAAVDALLWIIVTAIENDRGFYPAYARSLEILARDH